MPFCGGGKSRGEPRPTGRAPLNRLMGLPVAGPSVPLAEGASWKPRGSPFAPDAAKSGRGVAKKSGHVLTEGGR